MLYEERDVETGMSVAENNTVLKCDEASNMPKDSEALGIRVTNVTAQWMPQSHEKTLSNVTVDIKPGMLVAVIGRVGAGKVRPLYFISIVLSVTQRKVLRSLFWDVALHHWVNKLEQNI
jgi:ABC-type multidrug transport system fused ATPase/permease subunit